MRLRDREGDLWVLKEDGWCSQTPCPEHGVQHDCAEHDHFSLAHVKASWGPVIFEVIQGEGNQ